MDVLKKGLIQKEKVTQKKPRGETDKGQRPKAKTEECSGAEEGKGKFTFKY